MNDGDVTWFGFDASDKRVPIMEEEEKNYTRIIKIKKIFNDRKDI